MEKYLIAGEGCSSNSSKSRMWIGMMRDGGVVSFEEQIRYVILKKRRVV